MADRKQYDWLNDPFDEAKAAREREEARMSGATKLTLGCGCLLVLILFAVLLVMGALGLASFASS